jgi:hypothetical protein
MVILTDDATNPRMRPTHANIVRPALILQETILMIYLRLRRCNGLSVVPTPMIRCSSTVSILLIHKTLFSHYSISILDSGHGGQTKDTDGDEGDGFDEGEN